VGRSSWGYVDPTQVRANMLEGMNPTIQGLTGLGGEYGTQAGQQFDMQGQLFGQGMGLMQGDSPILQAMRQQQAGALADVGAQQNLQQNRALAARGMGGGGLSNILSQKTASTMGEQSSQGLLGIQKFGLEAGGQMAQLGQGYGQVGMQGLQGQGNALGSLGAIQSQANQGQIAQMQTNAANKASYLQAKAARERAARQRRGGLLGGVVGGIAGSLIPGVGPALGYSLGSSIGAG
tara:strand:+ start:351 stop:1055 length:705 start_codon:yes stop_codon:yes gene_type:complete